MEAKLNDLKTELTTIGLANIDALKDLPLGAYPIEAQKKLEQYGEKVQEIKKLKESIQIVKSTI